MIFVKSILVGIGRFFGSLFRPPFRSADWMDNGSRRKHGWARLYRKIWGYRQLRGLFFPKFHSPEWNSYVYDYHHGYPTYCNRQLGRAEKLIDSSRQTKQADS